MNYASTTQFVPPRRIGICEPMHPTATWDFNFPDTSPPLNSHLDNQVHNLFFFFFFFLNWPYKWSTSKPLSVTRCIIIHCNIKLFVILFYFVFVCLVGGYFA